MLAISAKQTQSAHFEKFSLDAGKYWNKEIAVSCHDERMYVAVQS